MQPGSICDTGRVGTSVAPDYPQQPGNVPCDLTWIRARAGDCVMDLGLVWTNFQSFLEQLLSLLSQLFTGLFGGIGG